MPDMQLINFKITAEMHRELQRQKRKLKMSQSDIIREAIEEWLEKRGVIVESYVPWGGYREPKEGESPQNEGEPVGVNLALAS